MKPTTLEEMFLPDRIYNVLSSYTSDTVKSMLFSGKQGLGKTLACEILAKKLGMPTLFVDLSNKESRSVTYNEDIKNYIERVTTKRKLIIIHEVDNISGSFMESLKSTMDNYATEKNNKAVFLFTTNKPNKVEAPVGNSRCIHINFNPSTPEKVELRGKAGKWLEKKLNNENITLTEEIRKDLKKLFDNVLPDFRLLHNILEICLSTYKTTGKLDFNFSGINTPNRVVDYMYKCYTNTNVELRFLEFITWYKSNLTAKHVEVIELFIDTCVTNKVSEKRLRGIYFYASEFINRIENGYTNDIHLIAFFASVLEGLSET